MSVEEAATALNISVRRVRQLLNKGRLKGTKHGRDWWIEQTDLDTFHLLDRKRGRPRK